MSIYDQIAAAAAQKDRYVDPKFLGKRPQVASHRPTVRAATAPTVTRPAVGPGISAPTTGLKSLAQARAEAAARSTAGGGGGSNPLNAIGRAVGSGFGAVLDVADLGRRAYQGVAGEFGDVVAGLPVPDAAKPLINMAGNPFQLRGLADNETGERDTSFDLSEIRERVTGDDAINQGFLGMTTFDDDLPGWLRPAVGFAGDLLTDPLTYATAGTVSAGSKVAGTAARTVLAQQAAKGATSAAGRQVADDVVRNVIREVGSRGAGGLTTKALKRSGATVDDLVKLGLKPDWGVSVGVGSKRVAVPGTRRIAESAANLKGSIKRATGASKAGRLSRELFTTAQHGENRLKQEILRGGANAPEAARGLALLGQAKGESWRWLDESTRQLRDLKSDNGKPLRRFSDDEAKELTLALEAGDLSHPLVKQMSEFFENVATDLQSRGVQFNTRQGYVPHRLSEHAIKLLNSGDNELRMLIDDSIDKPEIFQKLRQSNESIADINAKWRQNHDYDLLETDARVLVAQYLSEGQEAVMKAKLAGDAAEEFGLVRPMSQGIDDKAVRADIEAATKEQAAQIARSVANRRQALNKATKVARKSVAEVSADVSKAKAALKRAEGKRETALTRQADAQRKLATAQEALDLTQGLAKTARTKEKRALTQKITGLQSQLDDAASELQSATRQLESAEKDFGRWAEDVRVAEEQFATYEKNFSDLMDERVRMDAEPVTRPAVDAEATAARFAEKQQQAADKFAKTQDAVATATNTVGWQKADVNQVVDRLSARIAEFDDWMARLDATKKRGRPTVDSNKALRDEQRQLLSDIRDVLRTSDDPVVQQIAKLEAQAIEADAAAMMAGRTAGKLQSEFSAGIDLLSNPRFQKYLVPQTDQGMTTMKRQVGDDMQMDEWYKEAIERTRQFIDPSTRTPAFRGMQQAFRGYQKAMNWWKGWALSSPGFVFRNLYSGMFGMYLDDVSPKVATRFSRYLKRVQQDPEQAMAWASKKYGPKTAAKLDEAYNVAAASGWGITSQEVTTSLTGSRMKANPLSADNPFSYGMRHASSEVEAFLRGGHAYAVLERGGSFEDALQRVEKFHFNYRDISDFDRAAKQAMPFWTFWSRNIGLQAQVYARRPDKINRSYINLKRNIEEQSDPDAPAPWYLKNDMMGILTPFGSETGRGRTYLTPDIPSARFPAQMANMADNPLNEIVSGLGPGLKIPAQLGANRDFFLDREYRNDLTAYDSTGEIAREAPIWGQLPVAKQLLGALPGTEIVGDKLLMQDNVQAAIEGTNPVLGRAARLVPSTERSEETYRQYWLNFLGAPLRWNDPGSQAGALATESKQAESAADKVWERIRLEQLVSEGGG